MPVHYACPAAAVVQRYLLGQLPEPEAVALEAHVSACGRCTETLRALAAEDKLAEALRGRTTVTAAGVGPEVERLIARLCAAPPARPAAGAATPEPGGPATTPEGYDFLAPGEGPDEMGRLGPYRVLGVLGAGGMGVVFRAEDVLLRRPVALKVIRSGLADAASRQRFLCEARAAAALTHDHVVPVYQVGEDRGTLFLAMPLLEGETLEDRLGREGQLPVPEVLRVGREIAEGLAAAHAKALIHRDIKPANVWLEDRGHKRPACEPGDKPASGPLAATGGRVKLLDFGLARPADDAGRLTQSGAIVGTPAYMAPEQARGEVVGTRADLFSLGCVLYRMAAGRPPFQAPDSVSLLVAVATNHPAPPRAVNPAVPPALSDLIVKLLAKKPEDRPPSARAVAEALRALEQQGPAPARPTRSRLPVAAAVAAGLAAVVLLSVLVVVRLGTGSRPAPGTSGTAESPPVEKGEGSPTPAALELADFRTFAGHTAMVNAVAFSPDGRQLLSGGYDTAARLWDVRGGPAVRVFRHPEIIWGLAFLPDGRHVLTGGGDVWKDGEVEDGSDFAVRLWDVDSGKEVRRFEGHTKRVTGLAVSADGRRLVTSSMDGTVRVWDVATGGLRRTLPHDDSVVWCVALSRDGRRALSGDFDGAVRLWDTDTGALVRLLGRHRLGTLAVAFSPDERRAATGGVGKAMRLWDLASGELVAAFPPHKSGVCSVAFSADGRRLVSTSGWVLEDGSVNAAKFDYRVRVWDVASGHQLACSGDFPEPPTWAVFSPDGQLIASGGDKLVHLLRLQKASAAPADKP